MQPINLNRLYKRLGYTFKDSSLVKKALTHRSAGIGNNECFEFVGDSILNFVIAYALFQAFPGLREGELSRMRSFLVRGECLAQVALELELGDFLALGPGELKTGGFRRASILADALEAVFAAIYLDSDFETTQSIICKLFHSRLHDKAWLQEMKDFKTTLQEWLQAQKMPLPVYELLRIEGGEHDQVFFVSCSVSGLPVTTHGNAPTRRKAEQMAAQAFLSWLEDQPQRRLSGKKIKNSYNQKS